MFLNVFIQKLMFFHINALNEPLCITIGQGAWAVQQMPVVPPCSYIIGW